MGWRVFGGVLYESRVTCGILQTKPATWPRDALRLSEHVAGYEPESTNEGGGQDAPRNWRLCLPANAVERSVVRFARS